MAADPTRQPPTPASAPPTVGPVDPYLRVYAFTSPLARDAYVLVPGGRTVSGADAGVGG